MYPDPDRPRRFGKLDSALLLLLAAGAFYIWHRVSDVLVYDWNWAFLPSVLVRLDQTTGWWEPNLLLEGLFTTFRLAFWSMLIASILGAILGILASSRRLLPQLATGAYIGLIRNIPPLVFIFVFYFFISSQIMPFLGLDRLAREADPETARLIAILIGPVDLLENIVSGILCLAMFEAAYIAVIVRAGILSIPKSQFEAAASLGLKRSQAFRLVILPQAITAVLPPLANQFIMLVKNSAIMSLISVQELTFIGTEIAVSTGRRFEVWITVALLYFLLCFGLSRLFARLERSSRIARS